MNRTPDPTPTSAQWRSRAVYATYGLSALVGLVAGFQFGARAGGLVIGVVASINAAVFLALICGGLAERMLPRR
ncbi:MAG: hypothetical protein ACK5TE_11160 [Pseudomonadota bacterium]|jgi:hypothetical protein